MENNCLEIHNINIFHVIFIKSVNVSKFLRKPTRGIAVKIKILQKTTLFQFDNEQ